MNLLQELNNLAFTKADLLKLVLALPEDVILESIGSDIGGYDTSSKNYIWVSTSENEGKTYAIFSHLEGVISEETGNYDFADYNTKEQFESLKEYLVAKRIT